MQQTMFRDSVLAKLSGCLVMIHVVPGQGPGGECPVCKGVEFREVEHGWTECDNPDGCSFAVLTSHLQQIEQECL